MENFPYLPQELVEEKILAKLACKSLLRFKCVCKHWNALFHDTSFLSHHISHLMKNQNSATDDVLFKFAFHREPRSLNDVRTFEWKVLSLSATGSIHTFKPLSEWFHICGHSNGILCCSIHEHDVILYNPLTTEFKHLPKTAESLGSWPLTVGEGSWPLAVGMGYDSFTHDFNVIRIRLRIAIDNVLVYYAEKYALSTDSWTVLPNTNNDIHVRGSYDFAMCFKRTCYWWAIYRRNYSFVILAVNMDDGVFQIVPKPPGVDDISNRNARSLTVWNDSISLVCSSYHTTSNVDIWMMGGFGCWTLMKTIKYITSEVPKPLVFWKGNELLMEIMSCREIKSYNVKTEEIKDVSVKDFRGHPFQVVNYVPSLVPLKGIMLASSSHFFVTPDSSLQ